MPRRKDPVAEITSWFEDASPEQADIMFAVVRGIMNRKQPPAPRRRAHRKAPTGTSVSVSAPASAATHTTGGSE
jgi:hypothetical protein